MQRVRTAVVGASGYSGEQLVRLLLRHPAVELVALTSRQEDGRSLAEVMPQFRGWPGADGLRFVAPAPETIVESGATAAFLALPHGVAAEVAVPLLEAGLTVIDLSADFRIEDPAVYREFYDHEHPAPALLGEAVYGLPEIHGEKIRTARLIASPGCYPTSVILPLVPLLRDGLIDPNTITTCAMSGVSGAGRKASVPLLFAECNESVRAYSVPKHRHLSEIEQELSRAAGKPVRLSLTTHLVPVTAGICTTTYAALRPGVGAAEIAQSYAGAYADAPFVRLLGENACPDTKHVVGSNFIDIGWAVDHRTGRAVLLSAEDNLIKGAAGQAVQSFNLRHGFPETLGLL
ncbi:MAG: N-acetyl-gamma-glutamyl-phosphate reductase [Verrucomicrobiales bacterium]